MSVYVNQTLSANLLGANVNTLSSVDMDFMVGQLVGQLVGQCEPGFRASADVLFLARWQKIPLSTLRRVDKALNDVLSTLYIIVDALPTC